MITIAVDAMGGDNAPRPEVEGSVLAARELGVRVLLVGQPTAVRSELAKHAPAHLPIEVIPASEVITMDDHPVQAFRKKKDSSVHVAARLVREAKADGLVSAGNTGAVMTVARFLLGTLESVDRVALAAPFPNAKGGVSVRIDVGADIEEHGDAAPGVGKRSGEGDTVNGFESAEQKLGDGHDRAGIAGADQAIGFGFAHEARGHVDGAVFLAAKGLC